MVRVKYKEGVFKSKWLSKFINQWVFLKKQHKVECIVYRSFLMCKKKLNISPLFIFFEVLEKIKPIVGLQLYRKKRGKNLKTLAAPHVLEVSIRYKKAIF